MEMKNPITGIDFRKYPMPRVRHHVSPQLYLPLERQRFRPTWYPPLIEEVSWADWFANGAGPDVVDIGCGRGGFLLDHALAFPEMNILGLEVRQMLVDWISAVVQGEHLGNAHVAWYSAVNGLGFLPSGSVQYATYLFADPWPKKRHHKRRLFSAPFLDELDRILVPGGRLYLATDVPEVAEHQRATLVEHGRFRVVELSETDPWPFPFTTDQERFCQRKQIPYTQFYATR